LRQLRHRVLHILDPIDDDRPSGAALHCGFRDAVDVWMIPVKPGRLVGGKRQIVRERIAGIDHSVEYFILMTLRRSIGPMKVQIDGGGSHKWISAYVKRGCGHCHRAGVAREWQAIFHLDDEVITGMDVQGRRLLAIWSSEAVKGPTVRIGRCVVAKIDL